MALIRQNANKKKGETLKDSMEVNSSDLIDDSTNNSKNCESSQEDVNTLDQLGQTNSQQTSSKA